MRSSGRSSEVSEITLAIDRNPLHLRRKLAGDIGDDVAVDAGHHQRNRAQAVLVEEPEPDVRNVLEFLADIEFEQALRVLCRVSPSACS